jgi:PHD/YefM family antitoxin component YafN of YafNO toxin-antitoxin module
MRISSVREFRDRATCLLRSTDPILVTRRGRLAGVFLPWKEKSLPIDLRRELFSMLTSEIARRLKKERVTEREIQEDFAQWRKEKRATRRRR